MFIKAKDNPFAAERVQALGFIGSEEESRTLWRLLEEFDFRGAITGPHGSGKTSVLEEIERCLRREGRSVKSLRLNQDRRGAGKALLRDFARGIRPGDFVLLDGADQLGPLQWLLFRLRARKARGLIITAHRRGRLPCVLECRPSPARLAQLVERLVPMPAPQAESTAARYFAEHKGNLRDALRAMYDDGLVE